MKPIILFLPEIAGSQPNACSYLRMIAPLSRLVREHDCVVEELVSLSQFKKPNIVAFTTNRTAILDFPGLLEMLLNQAMQNIQIHWDTDDFSYSIDPNEKEALYLGKLQLAQVYMEEHANLLTTSTEFIRRNSTFPSKWNLVRNSIPDSSWANVKNKDFNSVLFFGLNVHAEELARLSCAFDEVKWKRLKKSKISIDVVGNFKGRFNKVFKIIQVPQGNHYYPRFASWLSNRTHQGMGLVLIQDSNLNKGKSALKFLEYSSMGMATAGYAHEALNSDFSSINRYFEISRNNPAEDLIELLDNRESLTRSAALNYQEVQSRRTISTDNFGMYKFYLEHILNGKKDYLDIK